MIEFYIVGGFAALLAAAAARGAVSTLWRRLFRPKVKGRLGESRVSKVLKQFSRKGARAKNDILINHGRGTSQIDHLLITKQGLLVLETKNYSGVIHGGEHDRLWTQSFPGSLREPRQFYNPIRQNQGHIHALRGILKEHRDIPIHSLVVFAGDCAFPQIPGVVSAADLKGAVKLMTSGAAVLTDEQVKSISEIIDRNLIVDSGARSKHNYQAGLSASADPNEIQELIARSTENAVYITPGPAQPAPAVTQDQKTRLLLTDTHAKLTIRGKTDTIEGFFEAAKRRNDGQPALLGGNFDYFICPFTGDSFPASEAMSLYQGLWITYLNKNPELVKFMNDSGPQNFGNSFRCKKVLALYNSDRDCFMDQVRSSPWYRNMASKQKKPSVDRQVQSASARARAQSGNYGPKSTENRSER